MFYSARTNGFYDPAIHGHEMPEDVIQISADDHAALLAGQSRGGRIVTFKDGRPGLQELSIEDRMDQIRSDAVLRMKDWITALLRQFTAGVPAEEINSWTRKSEAARAHLAGAAPHPILLAEAAITGETTKVLAGKIATLADQYEVIIAKVTGLRRMTLLAIAAAETPEAVEAALMDALTTATTMATALGLEAPHTPQQGVPQ